jgi:hypothetical protein
VHPMKRECIILATVMHAADHYYIGKKAPTSGGSEIFNYSSPMVSALVRPVKYKTRRFLCKERAHYDVVCKALYDACAKHDKEFADSALTIGVSV